MPKGVYIRTEQNKKNLSLSAAGRVFSLETRKKLSEGKRGNKHWAWGKKFSDERRKQMSEMQKRIGNKPPSRKGIKMSMESRKKMSETRKKLGIIPPSNKGKPMTAEQKVKISLAHRKRWDIIGRKKKVRGRYMGWQYIEWRRLVFTRDNWTCQKCGAKGGKDVKVYLQAHHIRNYAEAVELRLILDNGITLCLEDHKLFHRSYGKRKNNIQQIIEFISNKKEKTNLIDREFLK